MRNARQLTGSLQRRAELPASGRKGNLFLRGKERKGEERGGEGRGEGKGEQGRAEVAENFAGHNVCSPPLTLQVFSE